MLFFFVVLFWLLRRVKKLERLTLLEDIPDVSPPYSASSIFSITTVLTMTFLGLEARTDLPKVPYPTALDFFVFLSFAFIFATIIQFAVVHYFTKYGSGECYFAMEMNSESSSDEDELQEQKRRREARLKKYQTMEFIPLSSYTVPSVHRIQRKKSGFFSSFKQFFSSQTNSIPFDRSINLRSSNTSQSSKTGIEIANQLPDNKKCAKCIVDQNLELPKNRVNQETQLSNSQSRARQMSISGLSENISQAFYGFNSPRNSLRVTEARKRRKQMPRYNSVSKIDKVSRIVFPILFAIINVLYWYSYLIRSERLNRASK